MFTGLIKELAKVELFDKNTLILKTSYVPKIGDSIAVNGACLTVVDVFDGGFSVELSFETIKILAINRYKNMVHIEPAMRLGDRVEGHIIQGHIDCVGEVVKINKIDKSLDIFVKIPKEYLRFVVPKGSIAIDGVSLTVNSVYDDSFRLTIIPHTIKNTLISTYKVGTKLNIETDMFSRYIYYMFKNKNTLNWSDVDKMTSLF